MGVDTKSKGAKMEITRPQSRRNFLALGAVTGVGTLLAGCGLASAQSQPAGKSGGTLYLTIVPPTATGKEDFPALIPAYMTLPSHTTVDVQIVNFDDATALQKGTEQFAKVTGTVGRLVRVESLDMGNPNVATGAAKVMSLMDPTEVSHTFTITKLGINVPIAPKARTSFTLTTGAPGTYDWRCMDPCGTGGSGWNGPMASAGYMSGKLTIA
jgi:hypothetical protein